MIDPNDPNQCLDVAVGAIFFAVISGLMLIWIATTPATHNVTDMNVTVTILAIVTTGLLVVGIAFGLKWLAWRRGVK